MTRSEYLKELDEHLIALSKEERDMAVSFYSEYFDEAGPENEQSVIDELGKPYNLAKSIISENSAFSKSQVYMDYKSKPMPQNGTSVFASLQKPDAFQGAGAVPFDDSEDIMTPKAAAENAAKAESSAKADTEQDVMPNGQKKAETGMFDDFYRNGGSTENEEVPPPPPQYKSEKKRMEPGMLALWIIIGIFVGIPVVCCVVPVVLAIILGMAAIGISSVVFFVAATVSLVFGIVKLFFSVPTGLGFIFASLMCAGLGFISLSLTIVFFGKLLPWAFKGAAKLFRKRRAV